MDYMQMSTVLSGHGFGINTNILETNVLNLAVVIAVVISFVGDALRELLYNRKKKIYDNITLAETRAQEMKKRISEAKKQLEKAEKRAVEIREQGVLTAQREKNLCISQAEDEANRLKQLKDESIRLQQKKAIQHISRQIVALSVEQAREKLETRMEASGRTFQRWVNKEKLGKYKIINQNLMNAVNN